ncbi:MAG: glycosyltransferase [Patescibacteria group bacterium]
MATKIIDIIPPGNHVHETSWEGIKQPAAHKRGNVVIATVLALIGFLLILIIKSKTTTNLVEDPLIVLYTLFVTTFQLSRVGGAVMFDRSKKIIQATGISPDIPYEPMVSYVIPCKNEENGIGKTIHKCFESDYPKDKIEVIVINDGSTDGTGRVLQEMQALYPNLVVVTWEVNRGKRHGMYEGFKRARGEIVVQLDSDSYLDPTTFRNLIEPFRNPAIGAVCAHADPENADQNFLTRMQAAYYFMSFRILKAAESTFFSVFCCSGCSSAYRKSIVDPIMDEWVNETFLGLPVTWGDDRALTNRVLKRGYLTIYTDDVQAYTICPTDFKTLFKQQVRWKKGWFVNSLMASKFIMKSNPFVALTYFFPLIAVTILAPFMATRALIYNPIVYHTLPIYYCAGMLLVAFVIVVYYRYVSKENKYWPYLFVWGMLNMLILSFVLFYALATIQNRRWGTR